MFKRNIGQETDIVHKEMFQFFDKKHRLFVLRPEGTSGVLRAATDYYQLNPDIEAIKLFYFGPVFRYERPKAGCYRQFYQFGVEILGQNSIYQDYSILAFAEAIFATFQITNYKLKINFIVQGENRIKYIKDLKASLVEVELCSDCERRLRKNPLRVLDCKVDNMKFKNIPLMCDYLSANEKAEFLALQEYLKQQKLSFIVDPLLVRGLDYYNELVFEFFADNGDGFGDTILAGGHYAGIVNRLNKSGQDCPGVGFALGLERMMLVSNLKTIPQHLNNITIIPIQLVSELLQYCEKIATLLRNDGWPVAISYQNRKLKNQLRHLPVHNQYVMLVGQKEYENQSILVKNLEHEINETVALSDLRQ